MEVDCPPLVEEIKPFGDSDIEVLACFREMPVFQEQKETGRLTTADLVLYEDE